jgi:hypothetical protein
VSGKSCARGCAGVDKDMTIRTRFVAASLVLVLAGASHAAAAVHIEQMTSTVDTTDDGSLLSVETLRALIGIVLDTLSGGR